jgi:ABC-type transport system involved in cytochrome c biogenesis ATPase subunit
MKLRFLHLPCFGPLRDATVVFQQNELLPRQGTLNFVVGVNGTGKSSLLRAVYVALHSADNALESSAALPFAFTLAYDASHRQPARTVLLWHPGGAVQKARLVLFDEVLPFREEQDWLALAKSLAAGKTPQRATVISGDQFMGSGGLREHLPRQVLAYTSGNPEPWEEAVERFFDSESLETLTEEEANERPRRWAAVRELALPDAGEAGWKESAQREQVEPQLPSALPRCTLLRSEETKLAALALVLWHSAQEARGLENDAELADFRRTLMEERTARHTGAGVRRLLQEADWFRATHLSLTLRQDGFAKSELKAALWSLYALAAEVVRQPLGRQQAVVPLGWLLERRDMRQLAQRFFPDGIPPLVAAQLDRLDGATTGAEAALRLLSPEGRLWEVFERLVLWQRAGLIEAATITVQRLSQVKRADGSLDEVVLSYESLSDGEQMLLGRMALLFLLQGMDGSLLLLDEPETHFNDIWKREIVDIVDDNVLKSTKAQVLVATHTSIALTDAFNEEVTLLKRLPDSAQIAAMPLQAKSFGASPSEIMREVFGATESVGQRAREFMDSVLAVIGEPEWVMRLWRNPNDPTALLGLGIGLRGALMLEEEPMEDTDARVRQVVNMLKSLAMANAEGRREPRLADAVAALERRLGAGFYQFELRRRIRALSTFEPGPERRPTSMDDVMRIIGPLRRKPPSEGEGSGTAAGA